MLIVLFVQLHYITHFRHRDHPQLETAALSDSPCYSDGFIYSFNPIRVLKWGSVEVKTLTPLLILSPIYKLLEDLFFR